MSRLLAAWLFVCSAWSIAPAAEPLTLHIAPDGKDEAAGNAAAPLASLEAARDRIRAAKAKAEQSFCGAVVLLHDGRYFRSQPFQLTAADSGTEDAPIRYRAADGATPRLIGGRTVQGFGDVDDALTLQRLPAAAQGQVRVADLKAHGIEDFGQLLPRGFSRGGAASLEVFFDGRPLTLARWPNDGWLTIAALPDGEKGKRLRVDVDRLARWRTAPDAWLFGYWHHGWADQFLPVAEIDPEARELTVGQIHHYGFRQGQRFFALNLLEELDQPGEWHLDRRTGRLYLWPPTDLAEAEVIVSLLDRPLIEARDVSDVQFVGLTLEASREAGVSIQGGARVAVLDCEVRNVGRWGIAVRDGRRHRIRGCRIHHTGEGGVTLSGGDRKTLEPAEHEAAENEFHHFSRTCRTYRPALALSGVGQRAVHNAIHHAPHMAIAFGGNDHLIEGNLVHHVLLETDDAGAMYIGRDWTQRGHRLRENVVRDSGPVFAPGPARDAPREPGVVYRPLHRHGVNLLYLDDAASGVTLERNILVAGYRGIMIGGGRDNAVLGNLFVGGEIGVWIDARGLGWAKGHIARDGGWRMYDKLIAVGHDRPPYSERYPGLASILDEQPAAPLGNRVVGNTFVGVKEWRTFQTATADMVDFADNRQLPAEDGLSAEEALGRAIETERPDLRAVLEKAGPRSE